MGKLIDTDDLGAAKFTGTKHPYRLGWNDAIDAILENASTVDIVHCSECCHADWTLPDNGEAWCYCMERGGIGLRDTDFCSYGEREGEHEP